MAGIDLIPRQYALQRRVWRRCKRFAAAMLSLVCLVATARGALWLASAHEQRQLSGLRQNEQLSAATLARARELEGARAAAQKELKALEDLRGRHRVQALIGALDQAYLSGIWFDEIRSFRTGIVQRAAGAAGNAPAVTPQTAATQAALPPMDDRQRIELAGHAVEHARLATFMTRLASHPAVSDLRLLDTASSGGDSGEATIEFRMSLAIAAPGQQ